MFWFAVITLAIHYGYRAWAYPLHYWPLGAFMGALQQQMTDWVFNQSTWINVHLLGLPFVTEGKTIFFTNGSWIAINSSCAGDKQILQFILLLLIYPGPWKQKAWYIPVGMILMHSTNILRIVLLSLVSVWKPDWWHIAHDVFLRGMFYVVILILWIIWMERFNNHSAG